MNDPVPVTVSPQAMSETQTATTAITEGRPQYENFAAKAGMMIFPCIFIVIWLTVVIFILVMFYRLVRAVEKIAAKIETGIPVKQQDTM
jgi:uncharacterized membrane protein